jgi:hypothetical protein
MAAPDPFSVIMNTISLAKLLQTTITRFVDAKDDEKTLVDQIRLSALALNGFVKMFGRVAEAGLNAADQALMAEICDCLQPAIYSMRDICVKIHEQASRWERFRKRMAWVTYRKEQLEALAAHMRHWSSLFNDAKESLPAEIKRRLDGNDQGTSSGDTMSSLGSLFNSMVTDASLSDVQKMKREAGEVTIVQTLGTLRAATFQGKNILVEYKKYDSTADAHRISYIEKQIGGLSNFLALADPITTGVLSCCGWIAQPELYRFGLLFRIPPGYRLSPITAAQASPTDVGELSTLRSIIAAGSPAASDPTRIVYVARHALNERISAACMVAVALFYLHSYSWVHETLRTSNVLMLTEEVGQTQVPSGSGSISLGRPFLIGFDAARSSQGIHSIGGNVSERSEDEKFAQDLFTHPDRQGDAAGDRLRYQMCHDQYSLGVVLLEIGMWMPLEKERSVRALKSKTFDSAVAKRVAIKQVLLKLAEEKLALTFGKRYQSIVIQCLAIQSTNSYDLSRFLYDVVAPLWEMKSALA